MRRRLDPHGVAVGRSAARPATRVSQAARGAAAGRAEALLDIRACSASRPARCARCVRSIRPPGCSASSMRSTTTSSRTAQRAARRAASSATVRRTVPRGRSSRPPHFWGAVATSKFAGLRFRAPVYRTLRELVMSYFDGYYNYAGERTLRRHSRPISLARFDRIKWMTAEDDLWPVMDHLVRVAHVELLPPAATRHLPRVDRRSYEAGLHGAPPH